MIHPVYGATPPEGVESYKETNLFTTETVPAALLSAHRTRKGVWGRILVETGSLEVRVYEDREGAVEAAKFVVGAGEDAIVEPEQTHAVSFLGDDGGFRIIFLRLPASAGE